LANSDSLTLGDRNATNDTDDFVGDIDETKIYRFALNSDEVKIEYNQGKAEVLGALSTTSNGTTSDNSSDRSYCIPGDTTTCTAPSGEWKLDENTGTTAQDTSTNGFSGTLSNGPTYAQGKIGSAVSFDGSNDLIELADQATLDVGVSDNLSISAWVYRSNTTADQQIVSKKLTASVGDVGYTLYQYSTANGGNTCVYISDGTDQSEACTNDNTTTTLNTWEHVAFTFDNSTNVITIYQNGRDATHAAYTVTDTVDSAANSICARIGSAGLGATCNGADSTHNFIGKIDQVRIYKAALSSAQIAWDYNRAKAVGYWKLDDCTGTTVNDSSGNSNTGTITAGAGGNTSAGSCSSGTSTEMWNDGTTGKFNSSLGFDGSDDTVNAGSGTSLDALTNKSVTAWINAASFGENSYGRIVDKGTDPSSSSGWGLFVCNSTNCSGNNLAFFHDFSGANDGWWTTPTNSISTGSWIHVAVTYNNSSASNDPVIYINGESKTITESITPAGTASDDSATSLFIGNRSAGDRTFDGSIDDVRVYNYILNSRQIKQVYNEGATARFGPASGQP
jgi:hypothetical protein